MKHAIIIGIGSDIGGELKTRLERDGWKVTGIGGRNYAAPMTEWDLLILAQGRLAPIGKFFECHNWDDGIYVNATLPMRSLREAWPDHKAGATVVFLSGPNMAKPSPTYTAYRAGKAIIESLVDTLNVEYPEVRFRILRPGTVRTKIHRQTLDAGERADNLARVKRIVSGEEKTGTHDEVYERLKALL